MTGAGVIEGVEANTQRLADQDVWITTATYAFAPGGRGVDDDDEPRWQQIRQALVGLGSGVSHRPKRPRRGPRPGVGGRPRGVYSWATTLAELEEHFNEALVKIHEDPDYDGRAINWSMIAAYADVDYTTVYRARRSLGYEGPPPQQPHNSASPGGEKIGGGG